MHTDKITEKKVEIYRKYKGDLDFFSRGGRKNEKELMLDRDWYRIESLLQDLNFVRKGQASEEYQIKLVLQLQDVCENEAAIIKLKKITSEIYK